jgi:hypothetical protein
MKDESALVLAISAIYYVHAAVLTLDYLTIE